VDFKQRCVLLTAFGCEINQEHEYRTDKETGARAEHNVNLFRNILLPFTAQEWCSICMREGEDYLGGCCGNMSAMQDIIQEVFRNSGFISC